MLELVTDASVEPVTLAEMKDFMKVDLTDEEDIITSLIKSARISIEKYCGIGLISKTYDYYFDKAEDVIKIPLPPLQSITTFAYNDTTYTETEISSSYYKVFTFDNNKGEVIKLQTFTYPSNIPDYRAFRIRFVNGYGATANTVPETLKQALKLTVSHWFENRESQELPSEAIRLLQQFKIYKI